MLPVSFSTQISGEGRFWLSLVGSRLFFVLTFPKKNHTLQANLVSDSGHVRFGVLPLEGAGGGFDWMIGWLYATCKGFVGSD